MEKAEKMEMWEKEMEIEEEILVAWLCEKTYFFLTSPPQNTYARQLTPEVPKRKTSNYQYMVRFPHLHPRAQALKTESHASPTKT